jgi:hypothetical protein
MAEEVTGIIGKLIGFYEGIMQALVDANLAYMGDVISLALLILLVFIYAVFIWKLYQFVATKNFLGKYFDKLATSESSTSVKLIFFIEYIIISPFIIFFWFILFSIFILLLTNIDITKGVETILIIATLIVATTRMTSYYNENLSKEIAKILPFTLLAIAITNPNFLNIERVLTRLGGVSLIFQEMFFYLLLIFLLEAILRFFSFLLSLFGLEETDAIEQT